MRSFVYLTQLQAFFDLSLGAVFQALERTPPIRLFHALLLPHARLRHPLRLLLRRAFAFVRVTTVPSPSMH